MLEKRKYIRLVAPIGVTYKSVKKIKRQKEILSFLRDIAGGGIRILLKDACREGDLLSLKIQIPHFEEPIEAIAEVVWVDDSKEKSTREAGLRFRDINASDLKHILEYVHQVGIG